MIQETSKSAYETIKTDGLLSGLQWEVYDALTTHGALTAGECARLIVGHQIDSIRPRFAELANFKVIAVCGERPCTVTGAKALVWNVTPSLPIRVTTEKPAARSKTHMLRQQVKELRETVKQLTTICDAQTKQLAKWGRPSKLSKAGRDPSQLSLG